MKCRKCKKPIPLSDKHCVYCGATTGILPLRILRSYIGRLPIGVIWLTGLIFIGIVIVIIFVTLPKSNTPSNTVSDASIKLAGQYDEVTPGPLPTINSEYLSAAIPVIDGMFTAGEWEAPAFSKSFDYTMNGSNRTGYLEGYFMNDNDSLYVAIKLSGADFEESLFKKERVVFWLQLRFDGDSDGVLVPGDDIKEIWANEPRNESWSDCSLSADGWRSFDEQVNVEGASGFSSLEHAYVYECKMPLNSGDPKDIAVKPGDTVGIKITISEMQMTASGSSSYGSGYLGWPAYPGSLDGKTYGKLVLASEP